MIELISFLALAFVLGVAHAFEADHVAAVTAMAGKARSIRQSALTGVVWGFGHTSSLLVVGSILLSLKLAIPDALSLSLESMVGVVLVVLGISTILRAKREKLHVHTHAHDNSEHTHAHSHRESPSHAHAHTSFAVGILHGLAGSGALVLLTLSSSETLVRGVFFILSFGLGSVLGMLFLGAFVGLVLREASRFRNMRRYTEGAAGLLSVVVGIVLLQEFIQLALY